MKNILAKGFVFNLIILVFLVISITPVSAHRMIVEPVEEGVVTVYYEGGQLARRAEVVVYDKEDNELARGGLDEEGKFEYPLDQEAALIVADDGMGHQAEYVVGEEIGGELPRGITVAAVLLVFGLIAGIFQYRVKKREARG